MRVQRVLIWNCILLSISYNVSLEQWIYLKNAGNSDPDVINRLETLTFEKMYELLFTDSDFITKMRQLVNDKSRNSSQAYYLREIQALQEHTKWNAIVKTQIWI